MSYQRSEFYQYIRKDLALTEGHRETVKAGFLETKKARKVPTSMLHVNPDDEFSSPDVGPNEAIIANYSQIARRSQAFEEPVFDEPIIVHKLKAGGYMILNGHHRWAGAIRAHVPKVRIIATNDGV